MVWLGAAQASSVHLFRLQSNSVIFNFAHSLQPALTTQALLNTSYIISSISVLVIYCEELWFGKHAKSPICSIYQMNSFKDSKNMTSNSTHIPVGMHIV
jgi:hypothetical protein